MFTRILIVKLLSFCFLCCFISSLAASEPTRHRITIHSVQLKNLEGQWVTIIEPDKVVDLETTEPGISFFNNGRVPAGDYVNFRLVFQENATKIIKEITGKADFVPAVNVQKGSFIGVWFKYQLPSEEIGSVSIYVDQTERAIPGSGITMSIMTA